MRVYVNGDSREIDDGTTVEELLVRLEMQPRYVAIERNQQLVPRTEHSDAVLNAGDELEIVTLVGGG